MKLLHIFGACVSSLLLAQTSAELITVVSVFNDTKCSSSPNIVTYIPDKDCSEGDIICSSNDDGENEPHLNQSCTTDPSAHAKSAFAETQYVLMGVYEDDCKNLAVGLAIIADDSCQITPDTNTSSKVSVQGGDIKIYQYTDASCKNLDSTVDVKSVNNGTCDNKMKFYTNIPRNNQGSEASHYTSTFWLTSIAATAIAIAALL